jgi:hypothetical protein
MPDAGTRTAPDYLVVVFPRSARGSCAGDGALAVANSSGDLTLQPATEGVRAGEAAFSAACQKHLCATGGHAGSNSQTSVVISKYALA